LRLKEWPAVLDLDVGRGPIVGGSAFERIHDVHVLPIQTGRDQNLIEKLTGRSYKGLPLAILLRPWCFSDHDE
jgi:hypothetical protein